VACSGGADSTALAVLLSRAASRLALTSVTLAHLDHALRPDSAADAKFVERLGARLGLRVTVERHPVKRRRGESPEAAARRVRYAFLESAARVAGANVVVTAHQMDDQAETVLLRMLRGTGVKGLAGIRPVRALRRGLRVRLVRPLLPFRGARLREWLTRWDEKWVEDPSNVDGNVRSRLRHKAIPVLAQCSGRDPVPMLARLADNARSRKRERPSAVVSAKGRGNSK
jgi:tRNA(Ile)-lysidine synthase